jgi:PAS domain S-box-containing protein
VLDETGSKGSARWTWPAVLASISLALIAGGYWNYRGEAEEIRQEYARALTVIAELKGAQIVHWRKQQFADARRIAGSPFLRRAVEKWAAEPQTSGLRDDCRKALALERDAAEYDDALVVTADGRILFAASADPDEGGAATRRAIHAALDAHQPVLSDLYGSRDGVVHIDSVVPIQDASGRALAVLVLRARADVYLYPLIQAWPTPSRTAETLLVMRSGDDVVFLSTLRHQQRPPLTLRVPISRADLPAVQAVLGKSGRITGTDYRGEPVLADVRAIPASPWSMVTKVDDSEILAEARSRAWAIALVVAAFIVVNGTVIALVHRHRQARLYRRLYEGERANREAQITLGRLEADQRAVLDNLPVGIAVNSIEPGVAFRYMNDAFPAFYRTTREQLRDQDAFWNAVYEDPEFRDVIRKRVLDDCASGDPQRMYWADIPIRRKEAATTYVTARNTPLPDRGLWISAVWDVTERKLAEEALRQNEEQFRAIFETASVGMAQADPRTGRWLRVNGRMCAITGYSAEELLGMRLSDVTHPDDRQLDWEAFQRVVRGEASDYRLEKRYLRKDGSVAWVNVNMTVLRDAAGEPVRTVGVIEDISERKRAEEALRASEERRHRLFDEATEGIVLLDATTGEILDCNRAFLELTEYELPDLLGKPQSVLSPTRNGIPAAWTDWGGSSGIGENGAIESDLLTKGGALKHVEIRASTVSVGEHPLTQAFFRDVTSERRRQHERETTLALMRILNNASGTHELLRDLTGLIRGWAGCEAVGVRLRDGDDFPYFETQGFPTRFVRVESALCAHDESGQPLRDDEGYPILECMCGNVLRGRFNASLPFFTPKGSFWTNDTTALLATSSDEDRMARTRNRCNGEGYESVALFALRHGAQVLGLLQVNDLRKNRFTSEKIAFLEGLADQIALSLAQREAQTRLQESEHFNREVIAGARDGIVVYDRAFRYLVWNQFMEDLTGLRASDVLGKPAVDLFPHLREQKAGEMLREALAGHTVQTPDGRFHVPATGKSGWFSAVYSPHRDPNGAIVGVVAIIRDATERKRIEAEREQLEAQLRQAQKMESVGRLAGGVAHDFNNTLTVILGHSELVLNRLPPSDPLRQDIQEVLAAGRRSAELTHHLLAFARKQTIQPKVLDLNRAIESTLKMLGRLIGEAVELVWRPGDDLWPVLMDPAQLDQILANLVVNARDAISGTGHITIQTRRAAPGEHAVSHVADATAGSYVLLAVSDDGCGMDAETEAHLFEPFFTTKPPGQGTGLGLATVYGIVTQNRGLITVSTTPGRGTTISIFLPGRESGSAVPEPAAPREASPQGSETVLLVEDEKPLLNLTKRLLEMLGYTVLATTSPERASRMVEEHPGDIHLLLTDVVMPEVSGRELKERIDALRPGIKCLFMSGYTADVIAREGVLDPDVHFLQKPFSLETLAVKIREALSSR